MISYIISRTVIMVFGTLYPAYASYKAVRSRNVREYVKWMMYWIVFAIFTCLETFTDIFLSWFPFYYELKILLVIWLLAPATKGSSILYRKFVHPTLSNREQEIDEYISKAKEQSYRQVLDLGSRGVSALMQTALKSGGGLVNQIKKSYSLSDLTDCGIADHDETDTIVNDPRLMRHSRSRRIGSSTTGQSLYFNELDVRAESLDSLPSAEDLSSGYSSGEVLSASLQSLKVAAQVPVQSREGLQRTASLTRVKPTRVTRSTIVPKKASAEDLNSTDSTLHQSESETSSTTGEEDFQDTIEPNTGETDDTCLVLNENTLNITTVLVEPVENALDLNVSCSHTNTTTDLKVDDVNKHMHEKQPENDKTKSKLEETELDKDKKESKPGDITIIETHKDDSQQIDIKVDQQRAGKYHKKTAPAVPQESAAITAKLVLKPGIIKPLSSSEVFCHSPKFRRKSRSRSGSPSPNSRASRSTSKSPTKGKSDSSNSALGKLAVLQKKIFGKDHESTASSAESKRKSWHEGLHGKVNEFFHHGARDRSQHLTVPDERIDTVSLD